MEYEGNLAAGFEPALSLFGIILAEWANDSMKEIRLSYPGEEQSENGPVTLKP